MTFLRPLILVFLFSLFNNIIFSQEPTRCGTDILFETATKRTLNLKGATKKLESIAKKIRRDDKNFKQIRFTYYNSCNSSCNSFLVEPYGTDYHLPVEFIQEAFDNLNDNFAGEFSDVPTAKHTDKFLYSKCFY